MIEKDEDTWVVKCCLAATRRLYGMEDNPSTGIRWTAVGMRHRIAFCPWCGTELPKEVPRA